LRDRRFLQRVQLELRSRKEPNHRRSAGNIEDINGVERNNDDNGDVSPVALQRVQVVLHRESAGRLERIFSETLKLQPICGDNADNNWQIAKRVDRKYAKG